MTKVINRELINAWNRAADAARGTDNWYTFGLYHEWLNNTKWAGLGNRGNIRGAYIPRHDEKFYAKKIKGEIYIYWECLTEKERWLLNDIAIAFFGLDIWSEAK